MYREALSHCMSGVVSRWNHTYKNGFMNTRFLSWPCFISSVGRVSFPQLAEIRFLSWPKHYQKKLFLHGRTIASYTRLTLLR